MNRAFVERILSRRRAICAGGTGIVAAISAAGLPTALARQATLAPPPQADDLAREVLSVFNGLPGQKALKLWAPADAGGAEWSATLNSATPLFVASAFKVFVLAEYFRQVEAAFNPGRGVPFERHLAARLAEEWTLDESLFVPGSPVFNPPSLVGKVSARTALEAMISHSDNTGTDMALAHVGADRVRAFIASIGLRNTLIPTSLRQFVGYIAGLPDWQATTWVQIVADAPYPPRPAMNDQCAMVSSPDDFVAFYPRALQGEFFQYPETLAAFRRILTWADAIAAMPLGVDAFLKGGSIEANDYYALCIAGGMYLPRRWVYYSLITNWTSAEGASFAEVEPLFIDTARMIFTLVRDRLGV